MTLKTSILSRFLTKAAKTAGNPKAFISAISLVILWIIVGIFWHFDTIWILILNTVATLNAALMVFVIQNTQNRESKALHLKIDELIRVTREATNDLIAIEEQEDEVIEQLRNKLQKQSKK